MNPHLEHLQRKLKELHQDASPLLQGQVIFEDVNVHKDDIYDSLFSTCDDPSLEMYTQMALELSIGRMLLILERQAKDQLPGGKYYEASVDDQVRAAAVPPTNTCSERDFAQLDMLMRIKPTASTVAYESIIMWSNNKTSEWLYSLDDAARGKVLDDARRMAPNLMKSFKLRQQDLYQRKLQHLRTRREKKIQQENKFYNQKVKLTSKLHDIGGLWTDVQDINDFKVGDRTDALLKDAIITQLQFRRTVLGSKGPKQKFQQSAQGKHFSLFELEQTLKDIIILNKDQEVADDDDKLKLQYFPTDEAEANIMSAKVSLGSKLQEGRRKIQVSKQTNLLPLYIENPGQLVSKKILHKFKEAGTNSTTWYRGEVISVAKPNGRLTKFNILYDGEEDVCKFSLLIDMEKGDLIVEN